MFIFEYNQKILLYLNELGGSLLNLSINCQIKRIDLSIVMRMIPTAPMINTNCSCIINYTLVYPNFLNLSKIALDSVSSYYNILLLDMVELLCLSWSVWSWGMTLKVLKSFMNCVKYWAFDGISTSKRARLETYWMLLTKDHTAPDAESLYCLINFEITWLGMKLRLNILKLTLLY